MFNNFYSSVLSSGRIQNSDPTTLNAVDYNITLLKLEELFLNRFKWKCSLDEYMFTDKYIERCILFYGSAGFFRDDKTGNVCLMPARPVQFNRSGDITQWRVYPFGSLTDHKPENYDDDSHSRIFTPDNIAVIYNDHSFEPFHSILRRYANKVSDLERTEEVYAQDLKQPMITVIETPNKQTAGIIQKQRQENASVITIFGKGINEANLSTQSFETKKTPSELLGLMRARDEKMAQICSYMGISDNLIMKGAQLSSDEVKQHQNASNTFLMAAYNSRLFGLKRVNEMFPEISLTLDNVQEELQKPIIEGDTDGTAESRDSA